VVGEYLHPGDEADTECFSAQVAEVEVDPETGRVNVLRLNTANDVGRIINPLAVEGQIEGGVIQGFGFGVMEEVSIKHGQVVNGSFGDYKIPTITDVPELQMNLVEGKPGPGPFGARPVAEFAVASAAPAIANAVFDAVGVRITETPITAEKVFWGLQQQQPQTALVEGEA
jgi:CO/xanthine dehydrogenase Mo-binding subunit